MAKNYKKEKRVKDISESDHRLGALPGSDSGEFPVVPPNLSEYMASIGRKGGRVGGKRRLETMSAKQRHLIAKRAAEARWNTKN